MVIAFSLHLVRWVLVWLLATVLIPSVVMGWQPIAIVGESMAPMIRMGDVIMVDADAPHYEGAVITYDDPDRGLITHRLRGWTADGSLVLRGDANTVDDPPVPGDAAVGVGRLLVPAIGLPVAWVQHRQVLALALAVAVVVLMVRGARSRGSAPPRRSEPPGPGEPPGRGPLDRRAPPTRLTTPGRIGHRGIPMGIVVPVLLTALAVAPTSQASFIAGTTSSDNEVSVATIHPATGLTATCRAVLTLFDIDLAWTPSPSSTSSGQLVQRRTSFGWETIATAGPTASTHRDVGLGVGTFDYRIVTTTATTFTATSDVTSKTILLGCA